MRDPASEGADLEVLIRADRVVQVVECLLSKHEVLSSDSNNNNKKKRTLKMTLR
jgi:hypothetical protein